MAENAISECGALDADARPETSGGTPSPEPAAPAKKKNRGGCGCLVCLIEVFGALVILLTGLEAYDALQAWYYTHWPAGFYEKHKGGDRWHEWDMKFREQREDAQFLDRSPPVRLDAAASLAFDAIDEVPRMDGATSFYPLFEGILHSVAPEPKEEALKRRMTFSRTVEAYKRLIAGKSDMIFVLTPSPGQRKMAGDKGVELILTPIGREAFVFVVHADHPLDGLTQTQVRDIYSGKISNWNKLGGPDLGIGAYQRPADSGSQTAMLAFMGDTPMAPPPARFVISSMMPLLEAVARNRLSAHVHAHRNTPGGIGYTFMQFVAMANYGENLKLLAVDGVKPSRETVADGSYPLIRDFYAVTTPKSPPSSAKVLAWLRSEEGRELIRRAGYTPMPVAESGKTPSSLEGE